MLDGKASGCSTDSGRARITRRNVARLQPRGRIGKGAEQIMSVDHGPGVGVLEDPLTNKAKRRLEEELAVERDANESYEE
jgi:hypothetical protein